MSKKNKEIDASRRNFLLGPIKRFRGEPEEEEIQKNRTATSVSALSLADAALDSGEYGRAAEQYDVYVKANPEDVSVRSRLGYCLYQAGRYLHAKIEFERVLRIDRGHGFAALGLALVLLRMDKPDKARAVGERLAQSGDSNLHQAMLELCGDEEPLEQVLAAAEEKWSSAV